MLGKNEKTNINKCVILTLVFICLIFTSIGFTSENSYAVDLNESNDNVDVPIDMKDELESSSINEDDLKASNVTEEIVQTSSNDNGSLNLLDFCYDETEECWTMKGRYFDEINNGIMFLPDYARFNIDSDVHYRDGDETLQFYRPFHMSSTTNANLDAHRQMSLITLNPGADGTVISNLNFSNAFGTTGSAIEIGCNNVLIENCTFRNNHCEYGGIISIVESVVNVTISNCIFLNNTAFYDDYQGKGFGATIGICDKNCTIKNCIFEYKEFCENYTGYRGSYAIYSNVGNDMIDYDLSTNNVTNYIKLNPTIDLAISMSINSTDINYFYIKIILNVSNIGIDDAYHIKIENNISSNLIYINSTANYDNGVIIIDNLQLAKEVSVEVIYKVNDTNDYLIITNVTADEFDVNLSNNNDTISFNVNPSCDLEISSQINQSDLKYGDLINWMVVIKNKNPDVAHNILVKDLIPNKLSNINLISDYNFNERINEIELLNASDEIQLNIASVVDTTGLIESNIEVSAFEFDYNKSNNQNTQIINVDTSSDLIVVCIANVTNPNYNDLVKFTLTITNAGPDIANNVKIENTLPKGFIYINSTLPNENGVFNIEKLDNGEKLTIDIITKVNTTGNYTNTVNITCDNYDSFLDNNNDSTSIYINETIDLEVLILSNILNDDFINWTVKVKNNGLNIAHNIIVNNLLPDYLIYVGDDINGRYSSQKGVLNITSLNVSEEFIFNIQTKANKTGLIVNNVSVLGDEYDYNLENNNYEANVNIEGGVDLVISITTINTTLNYGDLIKINIEVLNNHTSKATDIEIQKEFSDALIVINQTQSTGICNNTLWLIDELDIGEVQTLEIICKVNTTALITSNVSVKAKEYDINQSNNFDSLSINASKNSDIELSYNIINPNPSIGENTILTVIVSNNGLNNFSDVKLITNLDDSLEVIEFNISQGEYSNNTWNIGNISSGSREYLNITLNITKYGLLKNNFEVKCLEDDINNISVVINASAFVDVNIEIYVNNTNPSAGDLVKFTITVSNNGFIKATNVVIHKLLPYSLKLINTTLTKGTIDEKSWFECCLERGEVQTLEMICEVLIEGKILYNVNISSKEFDINLTNNQASILINVSNKTLNNTNVSNLTGKSSIAIKKVTSKASIIAKKISIIKKSSRVNKIKIILRGKQVILKKNLKFQYTGKNKVKIKLAKSLKGKTVTFKFDSKNYMVKVNENGYISIKLTKKLSSGKIYKGITSWKAFKVYKNKKLTVIFKNKLYKVKTNKNGVAIFKVTNKMVKNIKKGKIVKYTINYQKDKLTRYIKIR